MTDTTREPTFDELDALSTQELKDRATAVARSSGDVAFFWDLVRHLPQAGEFASEDGATTGMISAMNDVLAVVEQVFGAQMENVGELEPLIRARLIDYLQQHSS